MGLLMICVFCVVYYEILPEAQAACEKIPLRSRNLPPPLPACEKYIMDPFAYMYRKQPAACEKYIMDPHVIYGRIIHRRPNNT